MRKFVAYIRTVEGYIERLSYAVFNSSDDSLDPYVHEELLVGWPESKVFWAKESGPSIGIAPPFFPSPLLIFRNSQAGILSTHERRRRKRSGSGPILLKMADRLEF